MFRIRRASDIVDYDRREAEQWLRRMGYINRVISEKIERKRTRLEKEQNDPEFIEKHLRYRSPANIENDIRTSGAGQYRSPQEATLSFVWEGQDEIDLLIADMTILETTLTACLAEAARTAGIGRMGKIVEALETYYFKGVTQKELAISDATFRKYNEIALQKAVQSIRMLREAGNTIVCKYDNLLYKDEPETK